MPAALTACVSGRLPLLQSLGLINFNWPAHWAISWVQYPCGLARSIHAAQRSHPTEVQGTFYTTAFWKPVAQSKPPHNSRLPSEHPNGGYLLWTTPHCPTTVVRNPLARNSHIGLKALGVLLDSCLALCEALLVILTGKVLPCSSQKSLSAHRPRCTTVVYSARRSG